LRLKFPDQFKKELRPHRNQPRAEIPLVRDDWCFIDAIPPRLIHRVFDVQPLHRLDLEMNPVKFAAHHIRRFR